MRWLLLAVVVSGCTTDTADVPATVVHATLTASCGSACAAYMGDDCGYPLPKLDTQPHVKAYADLDPDAVAGLVQIQYAGDVTGYNEEVPRADYVLPQGGPAEIYALFDYSLLYRIDGDGNVTDIDATRLASASGSTLHFAYQGNTEDHVIDPPRSVNVETESAGACCSVGDPQELGIAIVLLALLRRRKLAA